MAGEIILELSKYEVFLKTVELGNITQAADVLGYPSRRSAESSLI